MVLILHLPCIKRSRQLIERLGFCFGADICNLLIDSGIVGLRFNISNHTECHRKAGGDCRLLCAKVDAMKRAITLLKREIKNIEAQMED